MSYPFSSIRCAILFLVILFSSYGKPYAVIRTYPGAAPCDTTLQACIDGSTAGDTVEIATNTVDESLDIVKSLTLRPASGFAPRFPNFHTVVASGSGTANNSFTIQGLTLETGIILVTQGSSGTLSVNILDNTIEQSFQTSNPAIQVRAGNTISPLGNMFFSILSNRMTVPEPFGGQSSGISISLGNSPVAVGIIADNSIVMAGNSQGGAIDLANGDRILHVDVIGNTISGANYNQGISLFQFNSGGTLTANMINNLIFGQSGNTGRPAAIAISCSQGTLNFIAINNTVAGNEDGLSIGGRKDLGAIINGEVANNIIADNTDFGLSIDTDFAATVSNRFNLVFNNGSNNFSPGPGTLILDPEFIGTGKFQLKSGSPAINAGDNSAVPPGITTDLANRARIFGSAVDMGAYELLVVNSWMLPLVLD